MDLLQYSGGMSHHSTTIFDIRPIYIIYILAVIGSIRHINGRNKKGVTAKTEEKKVHRTRVIESHNMTLSMLEVYKRVLISTAADL
jgi:hypothetical protein